MSNTSVVRLFLRLTNLSSYPPFLALLEFRRRLVSKARDPLLCTGYLSFLTTAGL